MAGKPRRDWLEAKANAKVEPVPKGRKEPRTKKMSGRLSAFSKTGLKALLDLFYPPRCAACAQRLVPAETGRVAVEAGSTAKTGAEPKPAARSDSDFCPPCAGTLERNEPPFCTICGEPFTGQFTIGFACPNCSGHPFAFDFATAAWQSTGALREAIHRFKYGRRLHLREPLARKLHGGLADPRLADALAPDAAERWRIVPVPLHSSRHRERGFNQSAEIARILARLTGLPCHDALLRIRRTTPQARLDRRERLENLAGAFQMSARAVSRLEGKNIVLVDDVFTTGSTTHECAAVLKKSADIPRVIVVTVAR